MLSFEEYRKVIDAFLMEMQGTCGVVTVDQLQQLPNLSVEIEEFKRAIQEPTVKNESLVGLAFGLFDEFIHATQDDLIRECYKLYVDMSEENPHDIPKVGQ